MTAKNTLKTCYNANAYTKVPDGGWGWAVAVAFFFVEAFTYGVIKSFGVFFNELMVHFDESNSRISWILSICVFVMTFTAPLSTVLSNRFGHRPVVMAGGFLVSLGTVTASFAGSVIEMYLAMGLLSGLGFCLGFLPTVTLLSQYFDKKRSLVTAVASTGECFAVFAFAPAITALKDNIGWRYSLLTVGVLQLNIIVCGALLRPLKIEKQVEESPKKETAEILCILENEKSLTSTHSMDSGEGITTLDQKGKENLKSENENVVTQEEAQMLEEVQDPREKAKTPLLDFSILKDCNFIFYSLFGLFATLAFFAPSLYIMPLSMSLGIDEDQSAYMLSTMAIAEIFGRIGAGWILNKKPIRKIYIELIFVVLLCVALITFPFATEFWGLITCSAFFGCLLGTVAGTHIPLLADDDVVGIGKMSSAVGVYVCIQSIAGLAGPPLGGVLVDLTQSYGSAFYSCAAGMALAAICLALVRPCKTGLCRNNQNRTREVVAIKTGAAEGGPDYGKPGGSTKSSKNNV